MAFTYKVLIDTQRDNTFSHGLDDITQYIETVAWNHGATEPFQSVAPRASLRMTINNTSGRFSQVNSSSDYFGLIRISTLIRVVMVHNGIEHAMTTLKIQGITPVANTRYGDEYQFRVNCTDPIPDFINENVDITLEKDIRVDEAITSLFRDNQYIYPYNSSYFNIDVDSIDGTKEIYDYSDINLLDFDVSFGSVPFVGDNLDRGRGANARNHIDDLMKVERTGLFYYDPRASRFRFLSRYHSSIAQLSPYMARTVSASYDTGIFSTISRATLPLVNEMRVNYKPRDVGAPGSVVGGKKSLPLFFAAQDRKVLNLRYFDPDNDDAQIGAEDVIPPVVGLDITATEFQDGTGRNWTEFVIVESFNPSAGSAKLNLFVRKVGEPLYIQTLQLRGTPIINYSTEEVLITDTDSIYLYDRHARTETLNLISTAEDAEIYAQSFLSMYSAQVYYIKSVSLTVGTDSSDYKKSQVIDRMIGETINLSDGISTNKYLIINESHQPSLRDNKHTVIWSLRPVFVIEPFVIDISQINGTDIIIT